MIKKVKDFFLKTPENSSFVPLPLAITSLASVVCILLALVTAIAINTSAADKSLSKKDVESVSSVQQATFSAENVVQEVTPASIPVPVPTPTPYTPSGNTSQFTVETHDKTEQPAIDLLSVSLMMSPLAPPDYQTDYSALINDGVFDAVSSVECVFTISNDTVYTADTRIQVFTSPDAETPALGLLARNSEFTRIAVSDSGWSMVKWPELNTPVYVETSRISTIKPTGEISSPKPTPTATPAPLNQSNRRYNSDNLYLYTTVRGIEVYVGDNVSEEFIEKYIKDIEKLPDVLANSDSIRSINITTQDLKEKFPSLKNISTRVIGVTNTGTRSIWINGNLYGSTTILHEAVHIWDMITCGGLSNNSIFQEIYAGEKYNVSVSPGNYENPKEFLASAAELYYEKPSRLASAAPNTYTFLKEHLK